MYQPKWNTTGLVGKRPPHLRRDPRNGIWAYRRIIPKAFRAAFQGKSSLASSLGTDSERFNSREFQAAYRKAEAEVEALLAGVETPLTKAQPPALTEREVFGLMRELLLAYEMQSPELSAAFHLYITKCIRYSSIYAFT